MPRETCYRCFWPKPLCWCGSITPIRTATKIVFLMHPKEFKQEKAATGRLTHLCLADSELHSGIGFDDHEAVQALLVDPRNYPVLLYPGPDARNLSTQGFPREELIGRRLTVFVLDATWSGARKMLRLSRSLQALPRVMFNSSAPSRYRIKQQPQAGCLSTLEATHELLCALERCGLDRYERPTQLLDLFDRMQRYQIACACDPGRTGYRRKPYSEPSDRTPTRGGSGARRRYLPELSVGEASATATPAPPSPAA